MRYPKHPLQITTRAPLKPDFKFELLPLHSPLLRQSLLVSFPPLIDMLKFSGYPYLIRGQLIEIIVKDRARTSSQYVLRRSSVYWSRHRRRHYLWGGRSVDDRRRPTTSRARGVIMTLEQACPSECQGAQCAFKDSMTHGFCNSHYLSHFAAFFIDARTKRSVVESFY